MKNWIKLEQNWELRQVGMPEQEWMQISKMPMQVAEVLLEKNLLPDEVKLGWCQKAQWVHEQEWEYRCSFKRPEGRRCRLICKGLDTLATIYLNGKEIGKHDDFYLPDVIEITDDCREDNVLQIRFHRIMEWLDAQTLPQHLEGAVLKCKLLRKPLHDFPLKNGPDESNYQGAVPGFTPVGIYDDVILETWDDAEITEHDICAKIEGDNGVLAFSVKGEMQEGKNLKVHAVILQDGQIRAESEQEVHCEGNCFAADGSLVVEQPELWWPVGFGLQSLYTVEICIKDGEEVLDKIEKTVGFRKIETPAPLAFVINGKKVRLWGGSMDPMQGYTHCYQPDRAARIFDMVVNANMNTLRIWGEGVPLPDAFYEEADRRGILIWQEFFMGYGAYPDDEAYGAKCVQEAEFLIKRIKHHPSLLLWCGGNETILGAEFAGKYPFGDWIAKQAFPDMLERVDPEHYYHVNSPYGGTWSNDPRVGDCHTYECEFEYPYVAYPNLISECFRTATPAKHSLEKIIRGPLWDEAYDPRVTKPGCAIMPQNWRQRMHLQICSERYAGNYWEYYDAKDADGLMYALGASAADAIKKAGEQVRRGSRDETEFTKRSKGYMACKLLDTWPKVFVALIDYFQEGYMPYYATKRMLSPVMLSFAREENTRLFAVNDSPEDFAGIAELGIYHLKREKFVHRELLQVHVEQGGCREVTNLDHIPFFSKDCVLTARLMTESGKDVYTCIEYVDVERRLPFIEPELLVEVHDGELWISANHFARCVEITGECEGDAFGWLFDDNYFDLMPGTVKKVKILGKHKHGILSVKAQYSKTTHKVSWEGRDL